MAKTLSSQAKDWREGRRLRAWELKEKGWSQREIASALGVTEGAVSQWMKRGRQGGVQGLRKRTPLGVPPRLDEGQRAELTELISNYTAEDYGFRGEVWTTRRVGWLIREEFGVSYHSAHVSRLLRRVGISSQKPKRRANQRDEVAIERWKSEVWPALKKEL